jgi:hypothetical protein
MANAGSRPDPHEYWKMEIRSMHMDQEKGKAWVVGSWFYRPAMLQDLGLPKKYVISLTPECYQKLNDLQI